MNTKELQSSGAYNSAYQTGYTGRKMPYRITFALDLFNGPQERELSKRTLDVMLRNLTEIDIMYLQSHPRTPLLYKSGVRYMEEPPGQEDWQDIPTTLRLGIGDCEDLSCWRTAELIVRYGIAAQSFFQEHRKKDGSYLYHILTRYRDPKTGQIKVEDPSRVLGMR